MPLDGDTSTPARIDALRSQDNAPQIVSISDIHGYLDDARSALTALGETDEYPALVPVDDEGELHWAGNNYVLVVNGDLVDRGDQNEACVELVARLAEEAPAGHVRYHLGNHEMAILFPDAFEWPGVYSIELDDDTRRTFYESVIDRGIQVAFEGYHYTYSHAGSNEPFDVDEVNRSAQTVARDLLEAFGTDEFWEIERTLLDEHTAVFGVGGSSGRGENADLLWMDFKHMNSDAPPQVVGHTMQRKPKHVGDVVCQNLIRWNQHTIGGEGVFVESPDGIAAVIRGYDDVEVFEP